jgi:hypothetical protein
MHTLNNYKITKILKSAQYTKHILETSVSMPSVSMPSVSMPTIPCYIKHSSIIYIIKAINCFMFN